MCILRPYLFDLMLLGPDRLHFSSDEIKMKIPCANHVFLIKHSMASTSSVWLSGIVKRGPLEIVQHSKIVQFQWESSFGDLFLKSFKSDGIRRVKVEISQTDQFINTYEVNSYIYI